MFCRVLVIFKHLGRWHREEGEVMTLTRILASVKGPVLSILYIEIPCEILFEKKDPTALKNVCKSLI